MADVRRMTVGQVVDFVITYNERHKEDDKPQKKKKRRATQAEIDAFLG